MGGEEEEAGGGEGHPARMQVSSSEAERDGREGRGTP